MSCCLKKRKESTYLALYNERQKRNIKSWSLCKCFILAETFWLEYLFQKKRFCRETFGTRKFAQKSKKSSRKARCSSFDKREKIFFRLQSRPKDAKCVRCFRWATANKQHYKRKINDTIMQRGSVSGRQKLWRSLIAARSYGNRDCNTWRNHFAPEIIFSSCHLRKRTPKHGSLNYSGLKKRFGENLSIEQRSVAGL